jgi:Flp pilus assembly protein TadG
MRRDHTQRRRGSQAVEFGLTLPVLLVLTAGAVDLGQYLYVAERIAAVAAEGARMGAITDIDGGGDPVALALTTTHTAWAATDLPGTLSVAATLQGAAPSRRIVVTATVATAPYFGLVDILPGTIQQVSTIRLTDQD